jgi:hypothetical protein
MAALFEVTSHSPASAGLEPEGRRSDPPDVTAGLAYIRRCVRGHRPFGILTGSARSVEAVVSHAAAEIESREDLHGVRVKAPTDSVQAFLTTCLAQLGFDLCQAGLDDLHNLLVVFLRHEGARGRRTVALIDMTEQCGPRVLEFMQTLSKVRAGATPAITFLLTGSRDLHRVLDSQGMAGLRQFTRERFDLDRALAWVTPANKPTPLLTAKLGNQRNAPVPMAAGEPEPGSIIVLLDGAVVERRKLVPGKLVIGRSPHSGIRLDSRYVSRNHAVLVVTAGSVTVIDLQSTNATLVNGQAATSQQLEHGDLLAIGNFRLRYDCRPVQQPVRES